MRSLRLFLVGYTVIAIGVLMALSRAGAFSRARPVWNGLGIVIATGLGIMLMMSSEEQATTETVQNDPYSSRTPGVARDSSHMRRYR